METGRHESKTREGAWWSQSHTEPGQAASRAEIAGRWPRPSVRLRPSAASYSSGAPVGLPDSTPPIIRRQPNQLGLPSVASFALLENKN